MIQPLFLKISFTIIYENKMKYLALIGIFLIGLLSACSDPSDPNYDNDYNKIKELGIKEAIALANDWKFSKKEIVSFITPKELTITFPDDRKVVIALPEDEMYVAIAPWITYTHSCSTHYLSSCQGELENKTFDISVKE
ncbi:MAG: CueP family metal-binding protein, partial [Candidatus Kapabacteria bacterium]|nr:CueP family metal-binding protein [Candidatus Kapabacteria bacterium]